MRNKTIPHSAFLIPHFGLLFAAFCGCVGSAEADEQESATTDRSGSASVLVLEEAVFREGGEEWFITTISENASILFTILEEATALGEGAKAQSENDCEC